MGNHKHTNKEITKTTYTKKNRNEIHATKICIYNWNGVKSIDFGRLSLGMVVTLKGNFER